MTVGTSGTARQSQLLRHASVAAAAFRRDARALRRYCVISLMALIAFAILHHSPEVETRWTGFFTNLHHEGGFGISNVYFGMTPDDARSRHPSLRLSDEINGGAIGTFNAEGARHVVWFASNESGAGAYRLRADRVYPGQSEQEVIHQLGRQFGPPATSDCKKNWIGGGQRCEYDWWLREGTRLTALSRVSQTPDGRPSVHISLTAVDGGSSVPLGLASGSR